MEDCDEILERLEAETQEQIALAVMAQAPPVIAMHLDLACNLSEHARFVLELC